MVKNQIGIKPTLREIRQQHRNISLPVSRSGRLRVLCDEKSTKTLFFWFSTLVARYKSIISNLIYLIYLIYLFCDKGRIQQLLHTFCVYNIPSQFTY